MMVSRKNNQKRSPGTRVLRCISNNIKRNGNKYKKQEQLAYNEEDLLSPLTKETIDDNTGNLSPSMDAEKNQQNTPPKTIITTHATHEFTESANLSATGEDDNNNSCSSNHNSKSNHAYKTFQQLQSVQSDLRKAIYGLVSLRAKSEQSSSLGCPNTTETNKKSAIDTDMRKEIKTVQGSVTLAKEQVDDLCVEWEKQSSSILVSSSASTASSHSPASSSPATSLQGGLSRAMIHVLSVDKSKLEQLPLEDVESDLDPVEKRSGAGTMVNKEVLALRAERDTLARNNKALVATLHSLVSKEGDDCPTESKMSNKKKENKDNRNPKSEHSKNELEGDKETLSHAVQTLTETLTSLMEERDRLSKEYQNASATLREATELAEQLDRENQQLIAELQGKRSQLQSATSDAKSIGAHGRVVSASLVFTRNELATARQRIEDLERTVYRLSQDAKSSATVSVANVEAEEGATTATATTASTVKEVDEI